jgi:hypothetical protein
MSDIGKIVQEITAAITGKTTRSLEEAHPMTESEQKPLNVPAFRSRVKTKIHKKLQAIIDFFKGGKTIW